MHEVKRLASTLDQVVIARPAPSAETPQYLCADAGYKGTSARREVEARNYQPHIKPRREEAESKRAQPDYKARRWVVERTNSWLNRYRKLLVSFEKTEESYVALLIPRCIQKDTYQCDVALCKLGITRSFVSLPTHLGISLAAVLICWRQTTSIYG